MSSLHYSLTFFLLTLSSATAAINVPRLSLLPRHNFLPNVRPQSDSAPDDFKIFYYNQTLDHFSYRPESYTTFKQKYVVNSKHWGGTANSSTCAPIFAYLGAEQAIDADIQVIGWLTENAPRFKALLLYIEHRFYGESIPFGLSLDKAIEDANTRGYFTSTQALADYAEVILHVKKKLEAENCPVIVFGASYGGMLAAWFRLKYPHITHGALASSAPILIINDFVPLYGYYNIVSKDFKDISETCYQTIKSSWSEIDRVASEPNGLSSLSSMFQTCNPLTDVNELKNYLLLLYAGAAQYNDPHTTPVAMFCSGINNSSNATDSIIQKIFAGVVAYEGNLSCYVNFERNASQTDLGWSWQTCSEMVYTFALAEDSMFQPNPSPVQDKIDYCMTIYGVPPRPQWASTYFGFAGGDIKLYLQRFGSNIIFSNGLVDPYSSGGILENLSSTLHAVYTTNGSHCLDVLLSQPGDPEWLVKQRKTEIGIIAKWIAKYYADFNRLKEKTR